MKIALIQLGRIGDMILATPAFHLIKQKYPESHLTVIAGRHNHSILKHNPDVDNILVFEKSPIKLLSFIFNLRKINLDFYIDPKNHPSKESKYIAKFASAKTKIYFDAEEPYSTHFSKNKTVHFTDLFIEPLHHIGIIPPTETPQPRLFYPNSSKDKVEKFLIDNSIEKFAVLNISASKEKKMWQNEKWIELINMADIKEKIVLSYSPHELEKANELLSLSDKIINFKSDSFYDTFALVSKCEYVITPDTALVHVAAAFDKPLFALYSGLDKFYDKFAPLSSNFHIVRAEKGVDSIPSIPTEKVIAEFREFYNNKY